MWNSYNILTFTILRHFRTVPMGTVCILWFFLVLRNFWVGTVKKTTLYLAYLTNLPYLPRLPHLPQLPQQPNLIPFIVYCLVILEGSKPPQLNGVKYPGALNCGSLLLNWQQLRQAASRPSPQPRQRCQPDEKLFEKIFNTRER